MDIPTSIEIDITDLKIMDTIHIESIVFPEGVTPVFDENYAVVAVQAPHTDDDGEAEIEEAAVETEGEAEEAEAE